MGEFLTGSQESNMERGYSRGVQFDLTPSTTPTQRGRSTLTDIIQDDIPQVVRLAAQQSSPYLTQFQDIYSQPPQYQQPYTRAPQPTYIMDDLTYRMRPNTEYSRYQPVWSWTDFTAHNRQRSPYSGRDCYSTAPDYKPVFNQYLTTDYQHSSYKPKPTLFTDREQTKERTPFFLQPTLPRFGYNMNRRERDIPARISSHANSSFPFRKYRSDFVPYAPYKSLHDAAKYSPNPEWLSFRPWGYKFRKARYVYVPEEENSSKSVEIERVMREARLRELVKGVYSTSFGDSVTAKVTGKLADYKDNTEDLTIDKHKSVEAETAVTQVEVERRKPLTAAEKRRRNETLAIGISRTELLKSNGSSEIGIEVSKNDVPNQLIGNKNTVPTSHLSNQYTPSLATKELTPPLKANNSPIKVPSPPPKDPTPPPKEQSPSLSKEPNHPPKLPTPTSREPTPPPIESTQPLRDSTPSLEDTTSPPIESTPPPKEATPPPKEATPQPKEATPPLKEPSPTLKDQTPPPKDQTPPPKEATPPPKELTPLPEDITSHSKEPSPSPNEETHPPTDQTEQSSSQREMSQNEIFLVKESSPPEVNPLSKDSFISNEEFSPKDIECQDA